MVEVKLIDVCPRGKPEAGGSEAHRSVDLVELYRWAVPRASAGRATEEDLLEIDATQEYRGAKPRTDWTFGSDEHDDDSRGMSG